MFVALRRVGLAAIGGLFTVLLLGPAPVSAVDNPTVSSVSPRSGSDSGGDTVTLKGSGFYCGTGGPVVQGSDNPYNGHDEPPPHDYLNVFFGSAAANILSTPSDGEMTVTSPSGEGTVDVTVSCGAGSTVSSPTTSADRYSYVNSIDGGSIGQSSGGGSSADAAGSSSLPSSLAQTGGGPAARPLNSAGAPWAILALLLVPAAAWLTRRRLGRR